MPDQDEKLTPADSGDLAASIAFALKFENGPKTNVGCIQCEPVAGARSPMTC